MLHYGAVYFDCSVRVCHNAVAHVHSKHLLVSACPVSDYILSTTLLAHTAMLEYVDVLFYVRIVFVVMFVCMHCTRCYV